VTQAAERLEVSPRRVRQLLAQGSLVGRQLGRDWAVDPRSLARHPVRRRSVGRPWHPSAAWAVLRVAYGDQLDMSPVDRSRAQHRLSQHGLSGLVARLRSRADEYRCYAHPAAIERLNRDTSVVRGGVSAVDEHNIDLVVTGAAELYVQRRHHAELADRYALDPDAERPNVILHVVDDDAWPFGDSVEVAPWPVVAVDLLDADDERSRRAGQALVDRHS
jgi:hypothetical protein